MSPRMFSIKIVKKKKKHWHLPCYLTLCSYLTPLAPVSKWKSSQKRSHWATCLPAPLPPRHSSIPVQSFISAFICIELLLLYLHRPALSHLSHNPLSQVAAAALSDPDRWISVSTSYTALFSFSFFLCAGTAASAGNRWTFVRNNA